MEYTALSVRLTKEEKQSLEELAKALDVSMSKLARKAINWYIEAIEAEETK